MEMRKRYMRSCKKGRGGRDEGWGEGGGLFWATGSLRAHVRICLEGGKRDDLPDRQHGQEVEGGRGYLRVALPSSTRPRRISSNRAKLSATGLSRHGLGSRFFLIHKQTQTHVHTHRHIDMHTNTWTYMQNSRT